MVHFLHETGAWLSLENFLLELFLWSWISSNRSPVTKVNNIQDPVAPSGGGKQLLKSFLFKKQVLFELETNSFKKHKNKCQKVI